MRQVPITEGLFTWPSNEPRLIASRCVDCDNHMFPTQDDCPKCSGSSTEAVELGRTGMLWTWTVQGYPPKSPPFAGNSDPASFQPFGVGYVEVDGKVRVESRLTVADTEQLEIDMAMEMVIEPLFVNEEGDGVSGMDQGVVAVRRALADAGVEWDDCPKCSGSSTEAVELGRTGMLWTWTVQGYPPKSPPFAGNADPASFEPFGVGYVEVDGKVRVESRLTVADTEQLEIDMAMEMVIEPLFVNEEGDEVVTFAFAPMGGTNHE